MLWCKQIAFFLVLLVQQNQTLTLLGFLLQSVSTYCDCGLTGYTVGHPLASLFHGRLCTLQVPETKEHLCCNNCQPEYRQTPTQFHHMGIPPHGNPLTVLPMMKSYLSSVTSNNQIMIATLDYTHCI